MKTSLRTRIFGHIWKDAANDPAPEFYRELENILYLIELCQDFDTMKAAFDGMEYKYFNLTWYASFKIMEVATNIDTVGYWKTILRVEE